MVYALEVEAGGRGGHTLYTRRLRRSVELKTRRPRRALLYVCVVPPQRMVLFYPPRKLPFDHRRTYALSTAKSPISS